MTQDSLVSSDNLTSICQQKMRRSGSIANSEPCEISFLQIERRGRALIFSPNMKEPLFDVDQATSFGKDCGFSFQPHCTPLLEHPNRDALQPNAWSARGTVRVACRAAFAMTCGWCATVRIPQEIRFVWHIVCDHGAGAGAGPEPSLGICCRRREGRSGSRDRREKEC